MHEECAYSCTSVRGSQRAPTKLSLQYASTLLKSHQKRLLLYPVVCLLLRTPKEQMHGDNTASPQLQ